MQESAYLSSAYAGLRACLWHDQSGVAFNGSLLGSHDGFHACNSRTRCEQAGALSSCPIPSLCTLLGLHLQAQARTQQRRCRDKSALPGSCHTLTVGCPPIQHNSPPQQVMSPGSPRWSCVTHHTRYACQHCSAELGRNGQRACHAVMMHAELGGQPVRGPDRRGSLGPQFGDSAARGLPVGSPNF